ncbi:MAG: hypothetical protein R2733_23275 [Acidimicrobiales bacterium]
MAKANPLDGAKEIQAMLVGYAKQETVDPLKTLGKFIGLGLAGGVFVFLGVFFLSMGMLRLLQQVFEGGSFASLLPYVVTVVVLLAAIGIIFSLFSRSKKRVLS